MNLKREKEFLNAVDIVCMDCAFDSDKICEQCPVRKTVDMIYERIEKKENNLYEKEVII